MPVADIGGSVQLLHCLIIPRYYDFQLLLSSVLQYLYIQIVWSCLSEVQ